MSTWTHVAGIIRIDDMKALLTRDKTSLDKIFIANTWYRRNKNGNLPTGSEGSLDVEIIDRNEDGTDYMRVVSIWGDLRDYSNKNCQEIKNWWYDIPQRLGKACSIRNAILEVEPEDGETFILTEKDMNCFKEEDYE